MHVQRQVKDILRQLRPANAVEFGLGTAVAELVAFWARRYPAIRFEHSVASELGLERRGEEAAYRIVQEGLSNAVRHGEPHLVRVAISRRAEGVEIRVEDDGGGLKHSSNGLGHMGLTGLEERVLALHGRFAVENLSGRGVRIVALLPRARVPEVA